MAYDISNYLNLAHDTHLSDDEDDDSITSCNLHQNQDATSTELQNYDNQTILPLLINCKKKCKNRIKRELPSNIYQDCWCVVNDDTDDGEKWVQNGKETKFYNVFSNGNTCTDPHFVIRRDAKGAFESTRRIFKHKSRTSLRKTYVSVKIKGKELGVSFTRYYLARKEIVRMKSKGESQDVTKPCVNSEDQVLEKITADNKSDGDDVLNLNNEKTNSENTIEIESQQTSSKITNDKVGSNPVKLELPNYENGTLLPLLLNCQRKCKQMIQTELPDDIFKNAWYLIQAIGNKISRIHDNGGKWIQTGITKKEYSNELNPRNFVKKTNGEFEVTRRTYRNEKKPLFKKTVVTLRVQKIDFPVVFLQYYFVKERSLSVMDISCSSDEEGIETDERVDIFTIHEEEEKSVIADKENEVDHTYASFGDSFLSTDFCHIEIEEDDEICDKGTNLDNEGKVSEKSDLQKFDNPTILPLLLNCKESHKEKIQSELPVNIFKNAWYLIDTSLNGKDVFADNGGKWTQTGIDRKRYNVFVNSLNFNESAILRHPKGMYEVIRRTFKNGSEPMFRKTHVSVKIDAKEFDVVFVRYYFTCEKEVEVQVLPHGNSKNKDKPYYRTAESTKRKLQMFDGPSKQILNLVSNQVGGHNAPPSKLPRDCRQILYEKKKAKKS